MLMNQKLADMGLPGVNSADNRAVEIVAKNLPMRHGAPLACDATVVSPLHSTGEARPRAAGPARRAAGPAVAMSASLAGLPAV